MNIEHLIMFWIIENCGDCVVSSAFHPKNRFKPDYFELDRTAHCFIKQMKNVFK